MLQPLSVELRRLKIFVRFIFFCRSVLLVCGETESALGGELANCEADIDENVLNPLTKVLEVSS